MNVQIEESWKAVLSAEFTKSYFKETVAALKQQRAEGATIYPAGKDIFHAFEATPFDEVRCVILGQDPYHGAGQAHGLSFSVPGGVRPPPSLNNIFREWHEDTGNPVPRSGSLERWARHGVLLLNAALTVLAKTPNSHATIGWQHFTDSVIQHLSDEKEAVVFILWGKFAQGKAPLIDKSKHLIIASAHPSPYSADNGFFGSRPFSKTNAWLKKQGQDPIDWSLEEG